MHSLDDLIQYIQNHKKIVVEKKTGWSFEYDNSLWTMAHEEFYRDDELISRKQIMELVNPPKRKKNV